MDADGRCMAYFPLIDSCVDRFACMKTAKHQQAASIVGVVGRFRKGCFAV